MRPVDIRYVCRIARVIVALVDGNLLSAIFTCIHKNEWAWGKIRLNINLRKLFTFEFPPICVRNYKRQLTLVARRLANVKNDPYILIEIIFEKGTFWFFNIFFEPHLRNNPIQRKLSFRMKLENRFIVFLLNWKQVWVSQ